MPSLGEAVLNLRTDMEQMEKDMAKVKQQVQDALDKTESKVNPLKMAWTELNSAMGVYKQVEQEVARAIDQTIGVYVERADAVKEMMRLTGMSAEDTSRLIEASDDLFVSQQTLASGFEFAIRQGYKPSAEWLGTIADKISAIPDPADRAKAAIDIFGRSAGPEMLKLLEQGSTGLNAYMAAIDNSMVVTDEAIAKSLEYKQNLDQLKDSWLAYKMGMSGDMVDIANANLNYLNRSITLTRQQNQGLVLTVDAYRDGRIGIEEYNAALDKLNISEEIAPRLIDSATQSYIAWAQAIQDASIATEPLQTDYAELLSLTMSLSTETNNYNDAMGELVDKQTELSTRIAELEAKQWLNDRQKKELADLKGNLDDVNAKIEETARKHEEASLRIVWSLLQARMAADGLTEAEFNLLIRTGEAFGIIDQETADTALAISNMTTQFEDGRLSVEAFSDEVRDLLDLPDEKTFTLTIQSNYNATSGTGTTGFGPVEIQEQAEGGNYLVTAPTLFMAGEAGPEYASFTPVGQTGGTPVGSYAGTTYYNNFYITNAGIDAEELARIQWRQELLHGS